MATWHDFELAEPEMGRAARRLLSVPGFGFAYLATIGRDGWPRLHPINLVWAADRLWAFIVPSLGIRGRALEVTDPGLRASALAACPFAPGPDHVLMELDLGHVLWAQYEPRGVFPPRYRAWWGPTG